MFFRRRIKLNHLSDLELIEKYKASEDNYFVGELYKRYTHLVYGVCLKYFKNSEESKDATMIIFERLLVDLLRYEVSNFKSWLHSVAKNHCLMALRKKSPVSFVENPEDISTLSMEIMHPLHQEETEVATVEHLEEGLVLLNGEQKVCIELFYLQEKCYQEIADQTGYTLNQVKSYIQNGKRNLKIYLIEKHAGRK